MESLEEVGKKVKITTSILNEMSSKEKNMTLRKVAQELIEAKGDILRSQSKSD